MKKLKLSNVYGELIGKEVIIVNNTSGGFDENTICKVVSRCNLCEDSECYILKGYWENKLMELEHLISDFELAD